jgi:hypothetical protein
MRILARELDSGEQPTFFVGAIGFAPEQRELITASLQRSPDLPNWAVHDVRASDARLVNGAKCRLQPNGSIRVAPGLPHERTVTLDLSGSERPIAFAVPLADHHIEPRCWFDVMQPKSLQRVLLEFDASLRLARAQWQLGMHLVRIGAQARHSVFHVSCRDKLLAVFDFRRGEAAIAPDAQPLELHHCEWSKRPEAAGGAPAHYVRSTPAQLAWHYVRHSEHDHLPMRYRTQPIYYRTRLRVPVAWLTDTQLSLLRELAVRPQTLSTLSDCLNKPEATLSRDLACLYFAGSITTTAGKALGSGLGDSTSAGFASSGAIFRPDRAALRGDPTVPAALASLRPTL